MSGLVFGDAVSTALSLLAVENGVWWLLPDRERRLKTLEKGVMLGMKRKRRGDKRMVIVVRGQTIATRCTLKYCVIT
jgi:hypothetical protein